MKKTVCLSLTTALAASAFNLDFGTTVSPDFLFQDTAFTITATCTDRDSNLWVGTSDGKLLLCNESFIVPIAYESTDTVPVRAIAQSPDGAIWFGTENLYKIENGDCRKMSAPGYFMDGIYSQELHWINSIVAESDSILWIAGEGVGALRYSSNSDTWKAYFQPIGYANVYSAMSLVHRDENGDLLFGGRAGLQYGVYRVDTTSSTLSKVLSVDSMDYTKDLILGVGHRNSRWWLTTTRGLYLADSLGGAVRFAATSELVNLILAEQKPALTALAEKIQSDPVGNGAVRGTSGVPAQLSVHGTDLHFSEGVSGELSLLDLKGRIVSSVSLNNQKVVPLSLSTGAGVYIVHLRHSYGGIQNFITAIH